MLYFKTGQHDVAGKPCAKEYSWNRAMYTAYRPCRKAAGGNDKAATTYYYPRYIAGENPAPPEDCGGIPGFYAQLEALADPNHPDHDDAKDWFGDYDPNRLDEQPIKDRLARIANRRRTTPTKTKPR